ncbi:hypothetical protein BSL82_15755 [Tardibacter chloracetimidivorans]|uniref:PD-(D/E)XK endonuclease-like domain-containing protein n=1 Tax=Tardibacter chloracetimidivorans TaxID=1921510 RepID=A0A1L3ZY72_9SPHN|nr:hypothetical protein [Tardibacter chloracetimidivorans]API60560.1 hypothetical protein BSL82_15755 [Tardibacter chloracetimidivorans]
MMDFTPSPAAAFSDAFQAHIDAAMEAANQAQPPRNYIGASRLGEECERMLGYEYHQTPKDPDAHFQGKTLRIFDRGHDAETRMANYLRLAGFTVLTERPDGRQFGFGVAWDDARGCYRISGHCDGVVTAGPDDFGPYPKLWEMKALGDKGWKDTQRKGVKVSKPLYYAQMQLYMAYLGLADHPSLFTAINGNTGEIYAELVPFDHAAAQAASDRGARVVSTLTPDELPRISKQSTDFRCKFCSYAQRCWSEAQPAAAEAPAPWNWGN